MDSILTAENIVKKYGNRTVLNDINVLIRKGDIYGFIGKNGAGKTTFMRVILSLTPRNGGKVAFFGRKKIEEVGLKVGSLIEAPGFYKNASAYENLKRFSILYGAPESEINDILKLVDLTDTGKRKAKNFSLGMKQRLGIAIALLGHPEFLILDEPINGLDPEGIKEIRDVILTLNRERNITFLISSHLLDELSKIATRYGIINNGVLIEEIDADELKERCKKKLIIECDDPVKARAILTSLIYEDEIAVNNNRVEIFSRLNESADFNRMLIQNGISVAAIYPSSGDLEEYFMGRIGG